VKRSLYPYLIGHMDLYVDTVCFGRLYMAHGMHIPIWTVLPHTTFELHCLTACGMYVQNHILRM